MRNINIVDSQNRIRRAGMFTTRGHCCKLRGGKFNTDVRDKLFYAERVRAWNAVTVDYGVEETFR